MVMLPGCHSVLSNFMVRPTSKMFQSTLVNFQKMCLFCLISNIATLIPIFLSLKSVLAGPYPKDDLHDAGYSYLLDRRCASHCGADNQYCCAAGEACYTNQANIAFCSSLAPNAGGGFAVYTTTYTETNLILRTSTITSTWAAATPTDPGPVANGEPICTTSLGESSCGNICCASNQRCAVVNSCTAHTHLPGEATGTTFSAPLRPTSGDPHTISATTTIPFQTPVTASGSVIPVTESYDTSGLSGGAIAGIVIGVIAGVILLVLACVCCLSGKSTSLTGNFRRRNPDRADDSITPSSLSEKKKKGGSLKLIIAWLLGGLAILQYKKRIDRKKANSKSRRNGYTSHTPSQTSTSPSASDVTSSTGSRRTESIR